MDRLKRTLSPKTKAQLGDIIQFHRKNDEYEGIVFRVRENSVLVEISKEAAKQLGYDMPNTVVRHGHYVIKKNGAPNEP